MRNMDAWQRELYAKYVVDLLVPGLHIYPGYDYDDPNTLAIMQCEDGVNYRNMRKEPVLLGSILTLDTGEKRDKFWVLFDILMTSEHRSDCETFLRTAVVDLLPETISDADNERMRGILCSARVGYKPLPGYEYVNRDSGKSMIQFGRGPESVQQQK